MPMNEQERDAIKFRDMFKLIMDEHDVSSMTLLSDAIGWSSEPISVLQQSPIGQNLHSLLEESGNPIMETALAYIHELEKRVKSQDHQISNQEKQIIKVQEITAHNQKLKKENAQIKKRMHHPSYK